MAIIPLKLFNGWLCFVIKNITTSTQCAAVRTKFSDIREPPQNLAEKPRSQEYEVGKTKTKKGLYAKYRPGIIDKEGSHPRPSVFL